MNEKFLKPYDPSATEETIYAIWEKSGFFNPEKMVASGYTKSDAKSFSIVLPPPNVTGTLHLGHVFENATQDSLIRYHRMKGYKALWIPGTDHSAIATQSKFEKELYKKEEKSRHDFDRKTFFEMIQTFALSNQAQILKQLKQIGSSLDWERLCFTLDETRQEAVYTAFKTMYDAGLIYQKEKVVNWDPKGQTTISDDEVVHIERQAKLYTFRYSKELPFAISTTRPETKLGDTAIAVHPDDARYKEYVGQTFTCTFAGETINLVVVADEEVDPELGTGALGVTPAHSIIDWEIAERHGLPMKQVINEYGKMMVGMEGVRDVKTHLAREKIVAWLRTEQLLEKEEDITQSVSTAERTGGIIEPLPKLQWWVDVQKTFPYPHDSLDGIEKGQLVSLKTLMRHTVQKIEGADLIEIIPQRFEKIYLNWIDNLRDWNISRQIIYGHQIPVWYKDKEIRVSKESPGDGWKQDTDTLDTWFSSGLWTFSTLGWPHKDNELSTYHPTSLVNPGYEILFFWVARMILMSTFLVGQIPFKTVLIHGMLRDAKGQKFSKSLDNGILPQDMIEKYGTDALRMALIVGTTPGQDVSFSEEKVRAYKKFSNKLWNIARFVQENCGETKPANAATFNESERALLDAWHTTQKDITKDMQNYRLYLASEKLYHYVWHVFADEILEESKKAMTQERQALLVTIFDDILKMLHPFMPFITEEIYQSVAYNTDKELLMVQPWPDTEL